MTAEQNIAHSWRTIGFTAATPGWRIVYVSEDGKALTCSLPGWLTQRLVAYDRRTCLDLDPEEQDSIPCIRIIAADVDGSELSPVDELCDFWVVLGPGDSDRTPEEVAAFVEIRRARKAAS